MSMEEVGQILIDSDPLMTSRKYYTVCCTMAASDQERSKLAVSYVSSLQKG